MASLRNRRALRETGKQFTIVYLHITHKYADIATYLPTFLNTYMRTHKNTHTHTHRTV